MRRLFSWLLLGTLVGVPVWDNNAQATDPTTKPTASDSKLSGIDLDNISDKISPSKNFYEYVNEGWLESTEIPADQSNYGSFSVLDDAVKEAIRTIIEEAAASDPAQGSNEQKVGDFFKSYTNVEKRNELGIEPAKPLLAEVNAATDKDSFAVMAANLLKKGIAGPFAAYISVDAEERSIHGLRDTVGHHTTGPRLLPQGRKTVHRCESRSRNVHH